MASYGMLPWMQRAGLSSQADVKEQDLTPNANFRNS